VSLFQLAVVAYIFERPLSLVRRIVEHHGVQLGGAVDAVCGSR
jgi:hypothetical protein